MKIRKLIQPLSCIAILIVAFCFLSTGCHHESFLAMDENYGILLPSNCEVIDSTSVYVGFDSIRIHKLGYDKDTITELFQWKEYDNTVQEDMDKMFSLLAECEKRDPSIQANGLIQDISKELPHLRYYNVPKSSGIVCYLLIDQANLVLYVCEANY